MDGKLTPRDIERLISALERIAQALERQNPGDRRPETEYR